MNDAARSAAAQAGCIDVELLIFDCAGAFSAAKTQAELEAEWAARVRPVYDQISERTLGILNRLYSLKVSLLTLERR